jgi:hypothetical protein
MQWRHLFQDEVSKPKWFKCNKLNKLIKKKKKKKNVGFMFLMTPWERKINMKNNCLLNINSDDDN